MATVTSYTKSQLDTLLGGKTAPAAATPLTASGAGVVGTSIKAAREDHQHPSTRFSAADRGLVATPLDSPFSIFTTNGTLTGGTIYITRVRLEVAAPLTNAVLRVITAGSGVTNSYVGVYRVSDLAQLAVTADVSSSLGTTGLKTLPFVTPTAVLPAGTDVYVAYLYNGTALQTPLGPTALSINDGITLYGSAGASQTALPSTLSTVTPATGPRLIALS